MNKKQIFFSSIFAGLLIGLAGWINLAVGKGIPGAVLFSVGLLLVCYQALHLYTGKAGTCPLTADGVLTLLIILLGNIVGTGIVAAISLGTGAALDVNGIIIGRLTDTPLAILCKGIGCGMLMEFAVWGFREKKTIVLIFLCVPGFILAGMYHCVADAYYYFCNPAAWSTAILYVYPLTVVGNFIGCNVRRTFSGK